MNHNTAFLQNHMPLDGESSSAGAIDLPSTSKPTDYISQPGLRATPYSGETIYLKRKSKKSVSEEVYAMMTDSMVVFTHFNSKIPSLNPSIGRLLDTPIHRLIDQLSSTAAANLQRV